MLTASVLMAWFTYGFSRLVFSIWSDGSILDTWQACLCAPLCATYLSMVASKKLIINRMPDSPWWYLKRSFTLSCGCILGLGANIVGDIACLYLVYAISGMHF